ncbi:host-nuclease inhibitor Gam family protein [Desulfovulcanus sp.]
MARRKPKNLYPIKDLQQANQAMAEIKELKRSLEQIEHDLNDTIDRAKANAEAKAAPIQSRLEALENGLLAFAEYNKEELFAKKRTVEVMHGLLGYRRSKEIKTKPKITWAMVLGKIKELGFKEAIRIKEQVNKEELRTWTDERLNLIGARRVEKDSFWYEVKEENLEEATVR